MNKTMIFIGSVTSFVCYLTLLYIAIVALYSPQKGVVIVSFNTFGEFPLEFIGLFALFPLCLVTWIWNMQEIRERSYNEAY